MKQIKDLTETSLQSDPRLKDLQLYHLIPQRYEQIHQKGLELVTDDLGDFVHFCKHHQINNAYYYFEPYEEEDYYVYPWEFDQSFSEEILDLIEEEIEQHNNLLDEVDFSRNRFGYLYTFVQGQIIYMVLEDDWFEKHNIYPSYLTVHELVMNRLDEVSEVLESREEVLMEALDKLHEDLINHPLFRYQTSKKKRFDFFLDYLENEADDVLDSVFFNLEGEPLQEEIRDFIEHLWRDKKMTQ